MVTAFFDSRSDAEQAIERLVDAGVSRDSIRFMPGDERDPSDTAGEASRPEPRGFWDSLGDWFLPDEDRGTYAEGLRRGGYLISVNASDEQYARVMAILDSEGTIDIDERAESWRAEGWSGTAAGASTVSGGARAADRSSEQVIPVAEEQLRVGKRDISHGRVRIRSYVVETPVEEQVSLREERVAVERRPADRTLGDADQAFQERTIEAEEHGEEAVVSKEARVKEEVIVRKEAEQRTETVSDTVRETKVEVEDERGDKGRGTGTTDRT
jgi:uncharacterized protein (TIGR02271 family)